jgi:drug/metabolite transporter (DMT)-like permease
VGRGGARSTALSNRTVGLLEVGVSSVVAGSAAVGVRAIHMPAGLLLFLRMGIAAVVLVPLFVHTGGSDEVRSRRSALRLAIMGLNSALGLLIYTLAIRRTDVAVAVFLAYMAPVYVSLVAPRLFHQAYDGIVFLALAIALPGMAAIVLPGVLGGGVHIDSLGLALAVLSGISYGVHLLLVKSIGKTASGVTITLAECAVTAIALSPLAAAELAHGYRPGTHDLLLVFYLALVTTAFTFTLWVDGVRRVRVEHASIIAYLEAVTAPLYAFLLLGEQPPWSTVLGGALIIVAGIIVVTFGKAEEEILP